MRHGKTSPERTRYYTIRDIQHDDDPRPFWDGGERVPLTLSPGVLTELHELRDARRARGRRAHFTPTERARVKALVATCVSAGWTRREIAKACGVTNCSSFLKGAD